MTSAVTALTNVGFTATTAEMLTSTTYRDFRIGLRAGSIVRLRPGLYRPGRGLLAVRRAGRAVVCKIDTTKIRGVRRPEEEAGSSRRWGGESSG